MADTFSTALKARKIEAHGYNPDWSTRFNADVVDIFDAALAGRKTISIGSSTTPSLAALVSGTLSDSHYWWLVFTGTPASAVTLTVPASVTTKEYLIDNQTGKAMTVKYAATAGVTVQTGDKLRVLCDGTTVIESPALPRFKRTDIEVSASVTPADLQHKPGDSRRYSTLADWAAVAGGHDLTLVGDYSISSALTFPTAQRIRIRGERQPLVTVTTNGVRAFECANAVSFDLDGVRFKGNGSATVPSSTFDGYAASSTGLVTVTDSTDVTITNCSAEDFYSGFSALNCERVWIDNNHVTDWLLYAIVASRTNDLHIHGNVLEGCEQTGGVGAYGISATGDEAGGDAQRSASICFNKIRDVPSWDAVMTHDFDDLLIHGNQCRNVRNGIDVGFAVNTNAVRSIAITDNYIEATTSDTWSGSGAIHNAILFTGFDSTHRASDAVIKGNQCKNFFTMGGSPTFSGSAAVIAVVHSDRVKAVDNQLIGIGAVGSPAGIYYSGTCDQPTVSDNTLQGEFISGGIRFASVIATAANINNNSIKQVDPVNDPAVSITSSTITGLAIGGNSTNTAIPFSQSGSTITYSGQFVGAPVYSRVSPTYGTTVSIDASLGLEFDITATNGTGFTVANPTNSLDGQRITITIRNASGGALGTVSWGGNYKMATLTNPANGFSRSIDFRYNGSNWVQISQTGVDVPN